MENIDLQLDNPIWHALTGPHAELGTSAPMAVLYNATVTPFAGLLEPSGEAFAQLADLTSPERVIALSTAYPVSPTAQWQVVNALTLEQFVCERSIVPTDVGGEGLTALAAADVEHMLALAAEAQPGPFSAETIRCGYYAGVRDNAKLVAMAGERLRLNTAVEISGVCTAASHRGKGLAGLLVQTLAARAASQGQLPFLHVLTTNTSAIRLYQALGFRHRRTMQLTILQKSSSA